MPIAELIRKAEITEQTYYRMRGEYCSNSFSRFAWSTCNPPYRTGCLQFFELQPQLVDLSKYLLALRAKEHPLQLLDQQHQEFDLAGAGDERRCVSLVLLDQQRLRRFKIKRIEIRKRSSSHARSMAWIATT